MADAAYGPWPLVILNTALFALFAVSFFHPRTKRDWRAMGAFTGQEWTDYAARTPAFVPWLGRRSTAPGRSASAGPSS
ncbi:hypothetical protein [Pseudonocardia hydrocarbonoxydans]|uniref:hypothetical protein n=1 Tax=Pseudonocardia hydrocarbonoxydans TaxID=76726 RepID=UPI0031D6B184